MTTVDLSSKIALLLVEGDDGPPIGTEPMEWLAAIMDRWPDATSDEVVRGMEIASEMARADDAVIAARGAGSRRN